MESMAQPDGAGRRRFLTRAGLAGMLASMAMATLGSLRFLFPRAFYEPRTRFRLGRPSDFPKGQVRFLADRRVFVFHDDQGMYVISAVCTHLGCVVARANDGFRCPCHGSVFDRAGGVVGGPAPRALEWLDVSLSPNGYLEVDLARRVEPETRFPVA